MKTIHSRWIPTAWLKLVSGFLLSTLAMASSAADNQLSAKEQAQGWQLLFNGKDMSQWRNFKKPGVNSKWVIAQDAMHLSAGGGGDLMTQKQYKNFELKLDWKIALAGNSGIFILADELGKHIYSHAVEVQILDNERHSDNKIDSHLSGSIYDIAASPKAAHKEAGQWNSVYIRINNDVLTVKQNGIKTIDIQVDGKQWNDLVAKSKFKTWQGFAKAQKGHIGLQDHSDPVWFKNIKIRELN